MVFCQKGLLKSTREPSTGKTSLLVFPVTTSLCYSQCPSIVSPVMRGFQNPFSAFSAPLREISSFLASFCSLCSRTIPTKTGEWAVQYYEGMYSCNTGNKSLAKSFISFIVFLSSPPATGAISLTNDPSVLFLVMESMTM